MTKKQENPMFIRVFFLSFFIFIVLFSPENVLSASDKLSRFQADDSPTPTPTATQIPATSFSYEEALLEAYLQLPPGPVAEPFLILDAVEFGPLSGDITIEGGFRDRKFTCDILPCKVPFFESDNISFRAYSTTGEVSERVLASVNVSYTDAGYVLGISSINKYTNFADSCRARWDVEPEFGVPYWAEFPQFYYQLNTQKTLHYLARKLIINGIVDVSSCSNGGLSQDFTWPTACGLEEARDMMILWQNQYDIQIWTVGKEIGIPPKLLKTLIQIESQFWPANQRFYVDEYGLGQVTQLGLDVLLRDDYRLFQSVCASVLNNCDTVYVLLPKEQQALIRGALLDSLDATCPYCQAGFDFAKAKQSIVYIGSLLKANCNAVDNMLDSFSDFDEASYEDYWKFTLFTYHSGITCFYSAADLTLSKGQEMTWENFAENTSCIDGQTYVDGFWGELSSFDRYLYQPEEFGAGSLAQAVFNLPPTPTPFPTSVRSSAVIDVTVFIEYADGSREPLDEIPILISLGDSTSLIKITADGSASFDMQGYPASAIVTVSLPSLYRSEQFILPLDGTKKIEFVFVSPILPFSFP